MQSHLTQRPRAERFKGRDGLSPHEDRLCRRRIRILAMGSGGSAYSCSRPAGHTLPASHHRASPSSICRSPKPGSHVPGRPSPGPAWHDAPPGDERARIRGARSGRNERTDQGRNSPCARASRDQHREPGNPAARRPTGPWFSRMERYPRVPLGERLAPCFRARFLSDLDRQAAVDVAPAGRPGSRRFKTFTSSVRIPLRSFPG